MATALLASGRTRVSLVVLALAALGAGCGGKKDGPVGPIIGPPTQITTSTGASQSAMAGTQLGSPITITVRDANGNAVPNVPVTLQVTGGDGSISPTSATTDGSGNVSFTWTLGKSVEPQTVTVSGQGFTGTVGATVATSFPLDLRFYGPQPSAAAQTAFQMAVARIRAVNVAALSQVSFSNTDASGCAPGGTGPTERITEISGGVIIFATVTSIDGPGKILASAGPCFIRNTTQLTALGVMRFDSDDIENLVTTNRLNSVVLHEMLHVIGIGTLWDQKTPSLITGAGGTDPRFTGPLGISACTEAGGSQTCSSGIPVENTGGAGTRDGHWREATFDSELMTGFAEAPTIPMQFSKMSIQSLADLGYGVNIAAADPFTIPFPQNVLRLDVADDDPPPAKWEQLTRPLFEITASGKVTPARRY